MNHIFFIVTQRRPSDESPDYRQTETSFLVEKTDNCWEWAGSKNPKGYGFSGIRKISQLDLYDLFVL